MIEVRNVGRLRRLSWGNGVPEAGPLVGVYGENGVGKTTLVAILRAARDRIDGPLMERASLPDAGPAMVELLTASGRVDFTAGHWTGTAPEIEIFDRNFVSENVYDGREVGPDQRQGLYRLALGATEVASAKAIDDAKGGKKAATAEFKKIQTRIEKSLAEFNIPLDDFRAITPAATPPPDLPAKVERLRVLRSKPDLRELPTFTAMPTPPTFSADGLRVLLGETAASLSAEAATAVRGHIKTRLDADGERWLRQGVQYAEGHPDCPYCSQTLSGSTFAPLFPLFFDDAYRRLQDRVAKAVQRVAVWETWSRSLGPAHAANKEARSAWSPVVAMTAPPSNDDIETEAAQFVENLRALILEKESHLLNGMSADPRVDLLERAYSAFLYHLPVYQQWVGSALENRGQLLSSPSGAIAELLADVNASRASVLAGSPGMVAELADLDFTEREINRCELARATAQKDLDASKATRTDAFVRYINDVLADFGAGFRLSGLTDKESNSRVFADFNIVLAKGGQVLAGTSIAASAKPARAPRFDTVLSEGDRTTLALAVFLAKCTTTPNINRIVVLDDPVTSLDSRRRQATMTCIVSLRKANGQVWVLSHDEFFLNESLPKGSTWVTFQESETRTRIVTWDPRAACRTRYARHVDRMEQFLSHDPQAPSTDDVWQKVRPVLEGYFRFRFPKAWEPHEWLGDFVAKGRKRDPTVPLSLQEIDRVATWVRFSNPAMHCNPNEAGPTPTESEVRTIVGAVVAYVQS